MQRPNPSDAVRAPSIICRDRLPQPLIWPWPVMSALPKLADRAVHLWRCSLQQSLSDRDLAVVDCDRHSITDPVRTQQFLVSRWWLRRLLGTYLQINPADLRFHRSPHGKPSLIDQPLHFNLSHCGTELLIAIAGQPIGVDLERQRSRSWLAIAQRYFPPQEQQAMQQSSDCDRWGWGSWVCKEAWIKLQGRTLANSLQHLGCDWSAGQPLLQGLESQQAQIHLFALDDWHWGAIATSEPLTIQTGTAAAIWKDD